MEFKDRVANKPNRIKLTYEDGGASVYATVELADEPIEEGTPLNAINMNKLLNKENNDYIVEQGATEIDGVIWTYKKWNSGEAVCWAKIAIENYYSQKILEWVGNLPIDFLSEPCVFVSLQAGDNYDAEYDRTVKYKTYQSGLLGVFVYDVSGDFKTNSTEIVSACVIGTWK